MYSVLQSEFKNDLRMKRKREFEPHVLEQFVVIYDQNMFYSGK